MSRSEISTEHLAARQYAANAQYVQDVIGGAVEIPEFEGSKEIGNFFRPVSDLGRSIVFATPHWGSYVRSFNLIGNSFPAGSRFLTVRGHAWNIDEKKLWAEINRRSSNSISVHQLFDRASLLGFARELKGGAHAFMLFDLFDKYGATMPVKVLDWQLALTYRWAELAFKTNSVVAVMKPTSITRRDISIYRVFDSNGFQDPKSFVNACMGGCAKCLEELILEEPQFWFMWPDIEKLKVPM